MYYTVSQPDHYYDCIYDIQARTVHVYRLDLDRDISLT